MEESESLKQQLLGDDQMPPLPTSSTTPRTTTNNFPDVKDTTYSCTPNRDLATNTSMRSRLQLLKISLVYFGIELLFSIEVALTLPLLLRLRVSESTYSYVYFVSPIVGFLLQPVLGVWSDRCTSPLGRRRPFILVLGIFSFIGISFILNGQAIGEWLGDGPTKLPWIGIILVGIGVTLLDFSADSCDGPLRAYIIDACSLRDQSTALSFHAFLGGLGASLGFLLTSIDWTRLTTFTIFTSGDEFQILYVISSAIFIACLFGTMNSVHEEPYRYQGVKDDDDDDEEEARGLRPLLNAFSGMPTELKRLLVYATIGWMAYFSTTLFFTDYIAQSVIGGDPTADPTSQEGILYNKGVKLGSICLVVYSICSSVSAVLMNTFLVRRLSVRTLFVLTFAFYMCCCMSMFYLRDIYHIMPFCSGIGVLLTALSTLPYQMISEFHHVQQSSYRLAKSSKIKKRGIGTDCAILCSCYFISQTIISLLMSQIIARFGNRSILVVASVLSLAGVLLGVFYVKYPKSK